MGLTRYVLDSLVQHRKTRHKTVHVNMHLSTEPVVINIIIIKKVYHNNNNNILFIIIVLCYIMQK